MAKLPQKMNIMVASELLNQQDGFGMTEVDQQMFATHGMQLRLSWTLRLARASAV